MSFVFMFSKVPGPSPSNLRRTILPYFSSSYYRMSTVYATVFTSPYPLPSKCLNVYGAVGLATPPASLFCKGSFHLSGLLLPLELPPPTQSPSPRCLVGRCWSSHCWRFLCRVERWWRVFPHVSLGIFAVLVEVAVWRFVL